MRNFQISIYSFFYYYYLAFTIFFCFLFAYKFILFICYCMYYSIHFFSSFLYKILHFFAIINCIEILRSVMSALARSTIIQSHPIQTIRCLRLIFAYNNKNSLRRHLRKAIQWSMPVCLTLAYHFPLILALSALPSTLIAGRSLFKHMLCSSV